MHWKGMGNNPLSPNPHTQLIQIVYTLESSEWECKQIYFEFKLKFALASEFWLIDLPIISC